MDVIVMKVHHVFLSEMQHDGGGTNVGGLVVNILLFEPLFDLEVVKACEVLSMAFTRLPHSFLVVC